VIRACKEFWRRRCRCGYRNGHDDPQNFSLDDWGRALAGLLAELDEGLVEPEVSAEPGGPALLPHPAFRDLAALYSSVEDAEDLYRRVGIGTPVIAE
jgi:hypothetical protein